jgi:hypothetical protein
MASRVDGCGEDGVVKAIETRKRMISRGRVERFITVAVAL